MENKRFIRTKALIGEEACDKLTSSTVMVVGCGAVGGYVIEALARSGVGRLIVVDFDVVDESNINRQIFALSSTIGKKKAEVARQRILDINPDCEVVVVDMFVNGGNICDLLEYEPDYIVDAIDTLGPKCELLVQLSQQDIPFISSMGAARKTDTSQIKVGNLNKTYNCSLARFIRKRLKKRGVDIGEITCVYSTELPLDTDTNIFCEEVVEGEVVKSPLGSLCAITGIFGLTIAGEVLREISKY